MTVTLILGGACSGKSRRAEALARASGLPVVYLATAPMLDDAEWEQRIARHRVSRPGNWRTIEEELALADVLAREAEACVLVDCLTLWLSNLMRAGRDVEAETERLCAALAA